MIMEQINTGQEMSKLSITRPTVLPCGLCKKPVKIRAHHLRRGESRVFCNQEHYGLFQRKRIQRTCGMCKKIFWVHACNARKGIGRTCSRKCHFKWQRIRPRITGPAHHAWRGGTVSKDTGYRTLKIDGYRITEHRYVMEQFLGRKLNKSEVVHHKDGNRLNNKLSNLELTNHSDHMKLHNEERRMKKRHGLY